MTTTSVGAGSAGPNSTGSSRHANRQRVLDAVFHGGELSQSEIAAATGLANSTVSNIVRELVETAAIVVGPGIRNNRPVHFVRLTDRPGLVVGVDVGHHHVTVAVADRSRSILMRRRAELPSSHGWRPALHLVENLVGDALGEIGRDRGQIVAYGVGLPAPIDSVSGRVGSLSILPGWVGVNATEAVAERFGVPSAVDNDANLGAMAEMRLGAGVGASSFAYLKLSDGLGAGLVVDGSLFRGRTGTAGEIGHTTVNEFGAVCRCGNRGCLETLSSTSTILSLLERVHGGDLDIAEVVARAERGDTACRRVIADSAHHIGVGVANLCNVFNPERIIIGGELAQAGDLLIAPMRHTLNRYGIASAVESVQIVAAALGSDSHLLGAVDLAAELAEISHVNS